MDVKWKVSNAALVLGRGNENWGNISHIQLCRGNLKL